MSDDDLKSDSVPDPCPYCGENRVDSLVWQDDEETVLCTSCGKTYCPGEYGITNELGKEE